MVEQHRAFTRREWRHAERWLPWLFRMVLKVGLYWLGGFVLGVAFTRSDPVVTGAFGAVVAFWREIVGKYVLPKIVAGFPKAVTFLRGAMRAYLDSRRK